MNENELDSNKEKSLALLIKSLNLKQLDENLTRMLIYLVTIIYSKG